MDGVVCSKCSSYLSITTASCPGCGSEIILNGKEKNVIDRVVPTCLVHRYDGSDLLEPAVVLKSGRSNYKVALKLQDYAKPVTVPKHKVYMYNQDLLSSVQSLRSERTASVMRFEQQIGSQWNQLQPFVQD
jgi:DNA-directed RNA polymerase subunit RPC12/RpoP